MQGRRPRVFTEVREVQGRCSLSAMELLDAAHRHPLNTQSYDPLGAIPRDAFGRLWEAIGDHVAERLCAGRGVLLPSLGTVTADPDNSEYL